MRYYFNMNGTGHETEYYTEATITHIPVYPATDKLDRKFESDESSYLWMVYDANKSSLDFADCKNIDDAYRHLLNAMNASIYERQYDL